LRIVDFGDLPPDVEQSVQLIDMTAGWGPMDFAKTREARRLGYPAADYFGVYAVEGREVLSMIRVLRIPYTTPNGTETVAAIQGVVTRRDRSRRGHARTLMNEVLRREKEAGSRFALLWTGRGMVAHALYNSAGYVDVYTPDIALKKCGARNPKPPGYSLKEVRPGDWRTLERLHRESTEGRLGFTPRPQGIVRALLKIPFIDADALRLIVRDGEPVGFGFVRKNPGWTAVEEMTLVPGADRGKALALFESDAGGQWLSLRNTFVRDAGAELKKRGYSTTNLAYYSLLAAPLGRSGGDVSRSLGVSSRLFTCQALDYF